jgi:hypothetical protein
MLQGAPAPADSRFNSWAAYLLGAPSGAGKVEQLLNPNSIYQDTWAAYVQDTWQATRDLTVSLGLRWEVYPFAYRPDGKGVSRFEPTDGFVYVGLRSPRTFASGNDQLRPSQARHRLNEKTVFRRLRPSADPTNYTNFRNSYPINFVWSMPVIRLNGVDNAYIPVTNFRQGLIAPIAPPDLTQGKLLLPAGVGTITYPKELDRGHIDSWNIAVQRELTPWMTVQAAYVGTRAIGQMSFVNINAAAPGTGTTGRALYTGPDQRHGRHQLVRAVRTPATTACRRSCASAPADPGRHRLCVVETTNRRQRRRQHDRRRPGSDPCRKGAGEGLAGYDRTHNLQAFGVWDLPFGKGNAGPEGRPRRPRCSEDGSSTASSASRADAHLHHPEQPVQPERARQPTGARPGEGHGRPSDHNVNRPPAE